MTHAADHIAERLDEFRRQLLAEQRRLLQRVAHLEGDLRWLDENVETEVVEEGQERSIACLLERLDEQERAEILAIDHALERMDRGAYGICSRCAAPIPLARLRAVPMAETCVACGRTGAGPRRT